jgi:hypothetical protein
MLAKEKGAGWPAPSIRLVVVSLDPVEEIEQDDHRDRDANQKQEQSAHEFLLLAPFLNVSA